MEWNSTCLMVQRLEDLQRVIHAVVRVGKIGVNTPLNKVQWDTLAQVAFVLKPFKDTTQNNTATLGNVIRVIRLLTKMADFIMKHTLLPEVLALIIRLQMKVVEHLEPLLLIKKQYHYV